MEVETFAGPFLAHMLSSETLREPASEKQGGRWLIAGFDFWPPVCIHKQLYPLPIHTYLDMHVKEGRSCLRVLLNHLFSYSKDGFD